MEGRNTNKEPQEALLRIKHLEDQLKAYQQRDGERDLNIKELEEKLQIFG